jgi:hypothetical protein
MPGGFALILTPDRPGVGAALPDARAWYARPAPSPRSGGRAAAFSPSG